MEFSMTSPGVWRLFGWYENICAGHTPKTSIFGDLRVKADQLSHSEDMAGQLTCLKVKVGHLTILAPDTVSSILVSSLLEATSNPCQPIQACFISKFYKKVKRKCAGNQKEQWLHCAQVKIFYLIVKVGYYPLLSLVCASV